MAKPESLADCKSRMVATVKGVITTTDSGDRSVFINFDSRQPEVDTYSSWVPLDAILDVQAAPYEPKVGDVIEWDGLVVTTASPVVIGVHEGKLWLKMPSGATREVRYSELQGLRKVGEFW